MSLDPFLQLALFAAFIVNLAFLLRFLRSSAAGLSRAGLLGAAAFAAFSLAVLWGASSGLPVRGGYDNEHDFTYLSARSLPPDSGGMLRAGKEASPLIFDLLADLVSGFSLAAHPHKNALLVWSSAMLLALFLGTAGLSPPAAAAGAVLLCFNSLGLLNASAMTTTGANMFYFTCALLAAARFSVSPDRHASAWVASALFLLMAARVELFVVPALLALSALCFAAWKKARFPRAAAFAGAVCLLLCGLWWHHLDPYWPSVGPSGREMLSLFSHAARELGEINLYYMFGTPSWLAPALLAAGLAFCAASLMRLGRRCLPPVMAGLAVWLAYFTSIFFSGDLYPLQCMRHGLYYFVPVAALAALCFHCLLLLAKKRRAFALGAGALLLCLYAAAGIRGAYAMRGELRTNDREWQLLIKAQRELEGCGIYSDPADLRHRFLVKYFGANTGKGGEDLGCMARYVSPAGKVFGGHRGSGWGPPSGKALITEEFPHRFYTSMRRDETRLPVMLKIGFFLLGEGEAKASALSGLAIRDIKSGNFDRASGRAGEAVRLDPAGALPNMAAASVAALFGQGDMAAEYLKASGLRGIDGRGGDFIRLAAAGRWCEARSAADRVASGEAPEELVSSAKAVSGGLNFLIGEKDCP